jgi:hypothetical protein
MSILPSLQSLVCVALLVFFQPLVQLLQQVQFSLGLVGQPQGLLLG